MSISLNPPRPILIVDDSEMMLRIEKQILVDQGSSYGTWVDGQLICQDIRGNLSLVRVTPTELTLVARMEEILTDATVARAGSAPGSTAAGESPGAKSGEGTGGESVDGDD